MLRKTLTISLLIVLIHTSFLATIVLAQASFERSEPITNQGSWGLSGAESENGPAFSFYRDGANGVAYAEAHNDGYTVSTFDPTANLGGVYDATDRTSLVFYGGTPYVFYTHSQDESVKVGIRISADEDEWAIETIDTNASFPSAAECGEEICLCYYDSSNGNLKFARGTSENWALTVVDSSLDDVGQYCNILSHSNGDIFIAYHDATNERVKIAQYTDSWSLQSLATGADEAWGQWSHLLEVTNGRVELRSTSVKVNDTGVADPAYFYSYKDIDAAWSSPYRSTSTYVGGYPVATIVNERVFEFVRYLRYSALFGSASYISTAQQLEDGSWMSGVLGNLFSCFPQLQFLDTWTGSNNRVYFTYSQAANCAGVPVSTIVLYTSDVVEQSDDPPPPDDPVDPDPPQDDPPQDDPPGSDSPPPPGNDPPDEEDENPAPPESPEPISDAITNGKGSLKNLKGKLDSEQAALAMESLRELADRLSTEIANPDNNKKITKALKTANKKILKLIKRSERLSGKKKAAKKLRLLKKGANKALTKLIRLGYGR